MVVTMFMAISMAAFTGCSKDEEKTNSSSSSSDQAKSGTIKMYNQSQKNSYLVTYNGQKYGNALLLPGRQKTVEVPTGYYQFTIQQQDGYVNGHQNEYTATGTVNSGSTLNVNFPKFGTLIVRNYTSDPYSVSINDGLYSFTVQGGYQHTLNNCDEGYYKIYFKQQSGYLFYPTEDTRYGTLTAGGTLSTNIE